MPLNSARSDDVVPAWSDVGSPSLPDDAGFDRMLPDRVRESSEFHWTTVEVCRKAATWLVTGPETRVLDVGCGPGKFCAVGSMTSPGHFTGVEQRRHLCRAARDLLKHFEIKRVQILHANVTELAFTEFDAVYLFNPFEENLLPMLKIDDEVPVRFELYDRYISHVRLELSLMRLGTRVVTYWGNCDEVPPCYDCVKTAFDGELRLWIKRRVSEPGNVACWKNDISKSWEFTIV